MDELLGHLPFVLVYLDDILVLSQSWDEHLDHLNQVFQILDENGFTLNCEKIALFQDRVDYLGFSLSSEGVRPLPDKVCAILDIAPPSNKHTLRSFIGLVQYYRKHCKSLSHLLAPLCQVTSPKTPFQWTPLMQQAFDNCKAELAKMTLLHFPDFTQPFVIHTDASDYQMGAVLMRNNFLLAFFSRMLTSSQHNYSVKDGRASLHKGRFTLFSLHYTGLPN
jgi:hypothetical protein